MITVYGLKNCDTCRKARKWLDAEGIQHQFHDVRADGLEPETLNGWIESVGWEGLLNRRGTTWRKLPDTDKGGIDAASARRLMLEHPAMIKRPVIVGEGNVTVGFTDDIKAGLKEGNT